MSKRLAFSLATMLLVLASLGKEGFCQGLLSISKEITRVRPPGYTHETISFASPGMCIVGMSILNGGPPPPAILDTVLSLDEQNPLAKGFEGRTGDIFMASHARFAGLFNEYQKEFFFPSGNCRSVPADTSVFIHTQDFNGTGSPQTFVRRIILYYTALPSEAAKNSERSLSKKAEENKR